jgi:hypothetical protein
MIEKYYKDKNLIIKMRYLWKEIKTDANIIKDQRKKNQNYESINYFFFFESKKIYQVIWIVNDIYNTKFYEFQ